jgi:hypothetical protein
VQEDYARWKQRVVAFQTPEMGQGGPLHAHTAAGKLIVVLTNEDTVEFNTTVGTTDTVQRMWAGYSFQGAPDSSTFNISIGTRFSMGSVQKDGFQTTLQPHTIQWWYEQ